MLFEIKSWYNVIINLAQIYTVAGVSSSRVVASYPGSFPLGGWAVITARGVPGGTNSHFALTHPRRREVDVVSLTLWHPAF